MDSKRKLTIIIWGIGDRTKMYLKNGFFTNCDIKGYVDSAKAGVGFNGKMVYSVKELPKQMESTDYLVICNRFFSEIYKTCLTLGIGGEKIIYTDWIDEPFVPYDMDAVRTVEPKLLRELGLNRYKLIEMNEKDPSDGSRQVGRGKFAGPVYMGDYFRYRSFEYMAELLEEDGIEGAVSELGVFRGDFSALLNQKLPQRKLYLFDTFEGFDRTEIDRETELGRCDEMFAQYHTETSVERMLGNLPFPEQAAVCRGLFPASVTKEAEEETYAFVSIDVDFEDSIYEGLKFFYPRLSSGGVIFLHDYNSAFLGGVKNAVKKYEDELGRKLKKVPFADRAGTLVIIR